MPWVRQNYAVTHDPARTIVGGSSAGGLAAVHAVVEWPDLFGNVLSLSGAFGLGNPDREDWLVQRLLNQPRLPLRFYLDVGLFEPQNLSANRKLREALGEKGYEVHYVERSSGYEPLSWQEGLLEGLRVLLGGGKVAES